MKNNTGKFVLGALIVALILAALPLGTSYAAGPADLPTPPVKGADPVLINTRLENTFSRQTNAVERIGKAVENFDKVTERAQKLIDRAREKGLDVAAVQSAFDAFKKAFPNGKPIYEKAKAIVDEHSGFDAAGKVTATDSARETVKSLAGTLKDYRATVGDFFKALREAVRAFREAHPRTTPTTTPAAG
jgi:hypothetical protein